VNVDFADVRTVMSEVGMAMMGSATVSGVDRARSRPNVPWQAVARRGQFVGGARRAGQYHRLIGLKMKEYHDVMNTIKAFTADDAMVIVGTVIDDEIGDDLRVTMIATGLGGAVAKQRQPRLEVVEHVVDRTGTDGMGMNVEHIDYDSLDKTPAVVRRGRAPTASSAAAPAFDTSDIPAFLRKQAD
jgi:cell division protein FtsZ